MWFLWQEAYRAYASLYWCMQDSHAIWSYCPLIYNFLEIYFVYISNQYVGILRVHQLIFLWILSALLYLINPFRRMNFPWKPSPVLNPCCLGLIILGCFCFLQEHDEPILKHLQDITVKFSEPGEPMVCQTAKQASVYYWHFLTNWYRFLIWMVQLFVKTEFHVRVPLRAQQLLQ